MTLEFTRNKSLIDYHRKLYAFQKYCALRPGIGSSLPFDPIICWVECDKKLNSMLFFFRTAIRKINRLYGNNINKERHRNCSALWVSETFFIDFSCFSFVFNTLEHPDVHWPIQTCVEFSESNFGNYFLNSFSSKIDHDMNVEWANQNFVVYLTPVSEHWLVK
jgi:hypothetical protein